jgi:hypothetical protein
MMRKAVLPFLGMLCHAADITLVDPPVLRPDSTGTATADLTLRNDGEAAVPLRLHLTDFSHTIPQKDQSKNQTYGLGTNYAIAGLTDSDTAILRSSLPKDAKLSLKLTVNKLWEAGEATARLRNADQDVGAITAIRIPADYNVQVVAATPETAEAVCGGDPVYPVRIRSGIQLKNNDPMNYRFHWSLNLLNRAIDGNDVDIPANGTVFVDLSKAAPHSSFLGGLRLLITAGTLRDEVTKGSIVLQPVFASVDGLPPAASKALPLVFRLRFWSDGIQQTINLICLVILLTLGGTLSIWVHYGFPNTSRALALKKRISSLEDKVNGFGAEIDSRWRVLLMAQPPMLRSDLTSTWWVFPGFSTTLDDVKARTDMFQAWVDITYSVSVILHHTNELIRAGNMPPTVLNWLEERCERALSPIGSGFTTPEEIEVMKADLKAAQDYLDFTLGGKPNPDLEKEVTAREGRLEPALNELRTFLNGDFAGLIDAVQAVGNTIDTSQYVERDTFSLKVELLYEFRQLVSRATPAPRAAAAAVGGQPLQPPPPPQALTRLWDHFDRFKTYLRPDTHESLRLARVFVTEMRQDTYEQALLDETGKNPPALAIIVDEGGLEPCVPVHLALRFDRQLLNEVAAPNEWTCEWEFGDGSKHEIGWEVYHAFPGAQTFTVTARLRDLSASPVPGGEVSRNIVVKPDETSTPQISAEAKNEGAKLGFVLLIAVAGLIATAQQQVQGLTFLQAVGAVIALGFGADTLKNLITSKSAGS